MSGAASHPYAQCLWRNDLKFFLQEQDMRGYSFPKIGNNSQTNQNNNLKAYVFRDFPGGTVSSVQRI